MIDGRSFKPLGVQVREGPTGEQSLEYTGGSAGGHVSTEPNPGDIQNPASFEAFSLDPSTGALRVSVVTVKPDASVDVSAPAPIP